MAKKIVETPLMKQYFQIKEKHPDAILLFRVGDFYETFADDAIETSKILGITLTKRANGAAQSVDLAGFPHHALDNYLPKLVRAGKRVAVCDQLEDPKMTKKLVKRGITELVTPGVVMNDNILDHRQNNYLAAIYIDKNNQGGLSLLDISTGEYLVSEGTIDYLSKLISNYQPKELLVESSQKSRIVDLIDFSGFIFDLEDWCFSFDNNRSLLLKHFGVLNLKGFGIEDMVMAISSAGAILNYLDLTIHRKIGHITSIRKIDKSGFVRLDSFTLRSLEIVSSLNRDALSLFDVINLTCTPMGSRLLRKWLVFPLTDIQAIRYRQQMVQSLYDLSDLRLSVSGLLGEIGDIERLVSRAAVGRISPREVVQLATSLEAISEIVSQLNKLDNNSLKNWANNIDPCQDLTKRIRREIRPDAPMAIGKSPVICPNVSAELDELRDLLSHGKDYLLKMQQRESESTGISSLKISYNNVFGYYIEVRNTHKDKVPSNWIRKQTLVNAERYITEELKHYEEKILGAEESIQRIETKLYEDIVAAINVHIVTLQNIAQEIARFDCFYGFAEYAKRYNYVCPVVDDSYTIDIKDGRHPVIERQLSYDQPYIPNDVQLDNERTQVMIITGPNMSGKSALLRQTALIALMAQIGSFVPASYARIGVVDGIFTRVGASDNISKGESTFMVEMQEASNILNNISDRSLILFDELGRGTSTYDGISIAWAIVEYLHNQAKGKAKTLFATHYHELNELEDQLDRVVNYNVSAKEIDGKMLFLRKLERGGAEHSFGIQVAKLGGMPQLIIDRATNILKQLEQEINIEVETPVQNIKAKKTEVAPSTQGFQMSIFQLDDPLLSQIREELLQVDINSLTPLEALNKLNSIQRLLKGV